MNDIVFQFIKTYSRLIQPRHFNVKKQTLNVIIGGQEVEYQVLHLTKSERHIPDSK